MVVILVLEFQLTGKNVNICCHGNNVAKNSKFKSRCQLGQRAELASYQVSNNTLKKTVNPKVQAEVPGAALLWLAGVEPHSRLLLPKDLPRARSLSLFLSLQLFGSCLPVPVCTQAWGCLTPIPSILLLLQVL